MSKVIFKNNPEYKEAHVAKVVEHSEGRDFVRKVPVFIPTGVTQYHLSRLVAANAQNIYSTSGITKDLLVAMLKQVVTLCNDRKKPLDTVLTDIATLGNNLLYRTKYPLDELCAIRMGAIYSFIEGEDPNSVNPSYTQRKIDLAMEDADLYDFFLNMGAIHTPAYKTLLNHLQDSEYFKNRKITLQGLTP